MAGKPKIIDMTEKAVSDSGKAGSKKFLGFLIALHIILPAYWLYFMNFDAYSVKFLGIIAELLWLPMLLLLFLLPVLDFYLWSKSSFQWTSRHLYLLLISAIFLLYMILNF